MHRHPTTLYPEINYIQVFHQQKGGICGFHAYFNAKQFVRAILAKRRKDRLQMILDTNIITK